MDLEVHIHLSFAEKMHTFLCLVTVVGTVPSPNYVLVFCCLSDLILQKNMSIRTFNPVRYLKRQIKMG